MAGMHLQGALAALILLGGSGVAANATIVTGTVTGTISSFNSGVDTGGYFSAAPNTSLLGDTMTIHYSYVYSGAGVSYAHDANGSSIAFTSAAAGSYVVSWTVGAVTLTEDLSNSGSIDVDHNGSPSRYDIGGTPSVGGFVSQSNISSSASYYDGILTQPLSGTLNNWSVFISVSGYPTSTWIALTNVSESGSVVPEPATLTLLGGSLAGLGLLRRWRTAR